MSRKKTIIKNIISNIGMQFVSSMLPFLILPYMIRYWGKETYGILVVAYSIQTFMYLLNGAIHMTLMKYVSEVYELNDFNRLNVIINDFWLVAFFNNFLVSLVLILIGIFGLHWLNINSLMIVTTKNVFCVIGGMGIIAGALSFIDGVMYGLQKIHENNLFRAVESILVAATAILVMVFHLSLLVYVLIISIIPILGRLTQFIYLKNILPQFHLNIFTYFDFSELIKLSRFSAYQITNQVSDILMYSTDKIIIQKVMGLPWVTMYEVSNKPNLLFQNFISLPLSAILPACSAAYAKNDLDFLNKILIQGTRIYLVLVLPVIFVFILCMKQFLGLWMGKDFISVAPCAQLFLITYFAACPFKVFSHMMVSKARLREYAVTKIIYAILNVPLSIFFVIKLGIIGGIIVTSFYWVVVYALTNLYVLKKELIDLKRFIISIIPVYGALIPLCILLEYFMSAFPPHKIIILLMYMAVACGLYILCCYKFVLALEEKNLLRFLGRN